MGKTSVILRHLYSLKTSSLDFTRYLHLLIQFDGEEKYLTNLKEPELTRLLDFLDKALDIIPVNDGVAQACLKKLQAICADSCTFPSSYIISGELAKVDGSRINVGKGLVLWEGTYRDKDVYIMPFGDPAEVEGQALQKLIDLIVSLKRLSHPNIVPFIGVTMDPFQMVAERVSDRNLVQYLEEHPEADRISLLLDIAEGLNYLHMNNLSFGTFAVPDITIDREGRARLTCLMPPWADRSDYPTAFPLLILPEIIPGFSQHLSVNVFCFGAIVIEAFIGKPGFGEPFVRDILSTISRGIRPDPPQGAQKLGLTDSLWDMIVRCLHRNPARQPNMTEVIGLLRELLVYLSMEADLRDFFEVCIARGRNGQGEKAHKFANELDKALDSTSPLQEKRKQYLRYLQKLCSIFDLLPSSFLLPQESVKLEASPFDSGGYSTVFKATFNERAIVIKVLNVGAQVERAKLHKLLIKEVIGWKWLRHENILPFVGVMFIPSTPISIASELMENGNIMDFVRKNKDHNRVDLLVGAVTGLEYLHEHNIVHGDLKGVNILIDSQRHARLGDFGLAAIVDESTSRTTANVGKKQGTIRWMAPELLYPDMFEFTGRFEKLLPSKGTDIYAIGMTILEVITGCVPFANVLRNETVMLKVIKGDRPDRPPSGLSETLWNLLVVTWVEQYAQKPQERPPASTMLTRLKECVDDWGKSIIPLVPEDWKNTSDDDDPAIMASLLSDLNLTVRP